MLNENKPKVLISRCLELDKCRYNGQIVPDNFINTFRQYIDPINVCPEVMAKMGVPRKPISIYVDIKKNKKTVIQQETNIDWTDKINNVSELIMKNIDYIDGAVLKAKSPSCGVYDAKLRDIKTNSVLQKGSGLFVDNLKSKFPNIIIEDEKRLGNVIIRDEFLSKLYLNFRFRTQVFSFSDLINFHKNNKYLIMMFSPSILSELGNIVAKNNKNNFDKIKDIYFKKLLELKDVELSLGKCQNSIDHLYGYLKNLMNEKEKEHYFKLVKLFRDKKIFLITIMSVLENYALKYEIEYLKDQTIFSPYPSDLLNEIKVS